VFSGSIALAHLHLSRDLFSQEALVVEVTPFTSGNHNLHRTLWGNEATEVTFKHTKNQWVERIKSEYHGILLWTQHQTIHRMPKKRGDLAQIPLGRSMHVSKVSWGHGQSVSFEGQIERHPERPQKLYFSKGMWSLHLQP